MDKRLSSLPSSCRKNLLTASISSRAEERRKQERREGVALYYMVSYLIMIACSQKGEERETERKVGGREQPISGRARFNQLHGSKGGRQIK